MTLTIKPKHYFNTNPTHFLPSDYYKAKRKTLYPSKQHTAHVDNVSLKNELTHYPTI